MICLMLNYNKQAWGAISFSHSFNHDLLPYLASTDQLYGTLFCLDEQLNKKVFGTKTLRLKGERKLKIRSKFVT